MEQHSGKDEKKERLLTALDRGMAMIHLDARRPGVRVPEHLRDEAHLRLNLSYRFDPPDLTVSDWGVRTSLSFSGSRFKVGVPWSALFAIASHATHEFWMFPEDLPPELLENQQAEAAPRIPDGVPRPEVRRPPSLKAVEGGLASLPAAEDGDEEADGGDEASPDEAPVAALAPVAPLAESEEEELPPEPPRPPAGRSHLRLVK